MTEPCRGPDPHPRRPRIELPPGTTETHFHLFGPASRYRYADGREYTPPDATPDAARHLFATLGIERAVVIQPSVYGTDNRCQLDQGAALGIPFRAVVVTAPEASDTEYARLHEAGARGVRFILAHRGGLDPALLERYADRMAEMGWHLQLMVKPHHLLALEERLQRLPCPVVIDHMAFIDPAAGLGQPAFQALLRLVRGANGWAKLTGAYRLSGEAPAYGDLVPFARALVEARPDRLVWGTDWPHVAFKGRMPNTTDLVDLLAEWVPDEAARMRILVDNPATLYDF
jgi:predicted TIM-barrel fold metal-dependent hydrolase